MGKEDKTLEELKAEIDKLSHYTMCVMWRFGRGKVEFFDSTNPISEYFIERLFQHFGGITPAISKQIGWGK